MKLVIFKIDGDGDYGALSFEQSGSTVAECYEQMLEENVEGIEDDEDGHWQITIQKEITVRDQAEADAIIEGMSEIDEILGDYDMKKNTNYAYLVVP